MDVDLVIVATLLATMFRAPRRRRTGRRPAMFDRVPSNIYICSGTAFSRSSAAF